ncbi:MAG: acyl-CoA thioesterase [Sphingobacteriales bacterium]|nr:MAG: acyl-CoA thioesterase [Sphingobacteriales bacterium]
MYTSETQLRVRYAETDQMGVVYYGNYAQFYEMGRAEAIRQLGFTYRELEALGIKMPVTGMTSRYLRPALYDDLLTIKTTLRKLPEGSLIEFHHEVYNEAGELLNTGSVSLVFYDFEKRQKALMHPQMRLRLEPFFTELP